MFCHNLPAILAAGYRVLESRGANMPGIGAIRSAAIRANLALDHVTAYRIMGGEWIIAAAPNASSPFVDRPMLSF